MLEDFLYCANKADPLFRRGRVVLTAWIPRESKGLKTGADNFMRVCGDRRGHLGERRTSEDDM